MRTLDHCEFSPHDFTATAIDTSDGRLIQVNGSGLCPTAGWELRLVAPNPGVVPHPKRLWLELRELRPQGAARVLTKTVVDAIVEDTRAEEVEIRFGWREGFVIPVRTSTGPRARRRAVRERADDASDPLATSVV